MKHLLGAALVAAATFAMPAQAEVAKGLWATQPDDKGQIGHVRIRDCGASLCGTIVKAFDQSGAEINTKNVGKQIVSGMKPASSGVYEGRVLVPILGQTVNGKMEVDGSRMKLTGCLVGICRERVWTKIR